MKISQAMLYIETTRYMEQTLFEHTNCLYWTSTGKWNYHDWNSFILSYLLQTHRITPALLGRGSVLFIFLVFSVVVFV